MTNPIKVATAIDLLDEEYSSNEEKPVFDKKVPPVGVLTEDGTLSFIIDMFAKLKELNTNYLLTQVKIEEYQKMLEIDDSGEDCIINESDYIKMKELVGRINILKKEISEVLTSREYICFDDIFSQWTSFRNQMDEACDNVILKQSQLEIAQEKMDDFVDLIAKLEEENGITEETEDGVKMTGVEFKEFIKIYQIISISGKVSNLGDLTDDSKTQSLEIIENKIEPKVYSIEDNALLIIEDIVYYDREDGIIKKSL